MNKKIIIEVLIIYIVLVGIVSFAFVEHWGSSEVEAKALVGQYIQKEYNETEHEIQFLNTSSNTNNFVEDFFSKLNNNKIYTVNATIYMENTTLNKSYNVNAMNGTVNVNS
ncbi:MAG: hypothetical protein FWH29_08200 [Methanobrevibacter sp.]|nr:hypothetical protein [Methanobrevibacter sp.]